MTEETSSGNIEQTEVPSVQSASEAVPAPSASSTDWKSSLADDLKNDPALSSIKDINSLAKGYTSAQRMLGGRIPIPSDDASDEVKNEFFQKLTNIKGVTRLPEDLNDPKAVEQLNDIYNKLGRPAAADRYELPIPENLIKSQVVSEDFIRTIKDIAHKEGLNQKQLAALADPYIKNTEAVFNFMETQKKNTDAFLRKTWGNAFEEKAADFTNTLNKFAEKYPDAVAELKGGYAGNNPVVIMALSELGRTYRENGTISPQAGLHNTGRTPEEALQQIADIRGNPKHAYMNDSDPGHDLAVKKMAELYADAFPDKNRQNES